MSRAKATSSISFQKSPLSRGRDFKILKFESVSQDVSLSLKRLFHKGRSAAKMCGEPLFQAILCSRGPTHMPNDLGFLDDVNALLCRCLKPRSSLRKRVAILLAESFEKTSYCSRSNDFNLGFFAHLSISQFSSKVQTCLAPRTHFGGSQSSSSARISRSSIFNWSRSSEYRAFTGAAAASVRCCICPIFSASSAILSLLTLSMLGSAFILFRFDGHPPPASQTMVTMDR
jgi:hypothetical protein